MKVLFIYKHQFTKNKNNPPLNKRLHLDLLEAFVKEYPKSIIIKSPSPHMAEKLYSKHKPDIIVGYGAQRISGLLNGNFFTRFKCPKVLIDIDYWKIQRGGSFAKYSRNKFDLILQRGYFDPETNKSKIPMVWLPFSINPDEIDLSGEVKKQNKIGFIGTLGHPYIERKKAVNTISKCDFFVHSSKKRDIEYFKFIKSMKAILTSTALYSPHGKMFEGMVCKTVVLTPEFFGEDLLFGNQSVKPCFVKYNRDCSDLIEKCNYVLNNPKEMEVISNNAFEEVITKHTHKERVKEMFIHFENLLQKKEITNPWNV